VNEPETKVQSTESMTIIEIYDNHRVGKRGMVMYGAATDGVAFADAIVFLYIFQAAFRCRGGNFRHAAATTRLDLGSLTKSPDRERSICAG
jgi:hypothetical protein